MQVMEHVFSQPRVNPKLPWLGDGSVFTRYLSAGHIEGGKGGVFTEDGILDTHIGDVRTYIEKQGADQVKSGFYNNYGVMQLFINLGSGCVLYDFLPCNTGKIFLSHYGDSVGLRPLEITPFMIQAELMNDLNEAFKMYTAEIAKLYD
jgi:hypothetical protein